MKAKIWRVMGIVFVMTMLMGIGFSWASEPEVKVEGKLVVSDINGIHYELYSDQKYEMYGNEKLFSSFVDKNVIVSGFILKDFASNRMKGTPFQVNTIKEFPMQNNNQVLYTGETGTTYSNEGGTSYSSPERQTIRLWGRVMKSEWPTVKYQLITSDKEIYLLSGKDESFQSLLNEDVTITGSIMTGFSLGQPGPYLKVETIIGAKQSQFVFEGTLMNSKWPTVKYQLKTKDEKMYLLVGNDQALKKYLNEDVLIVGKIKDGYSLGQPGSYLNVDAIDSIENANKVLAEPLQNRVMVNNNDENVNKPENWCGTPDPNIVTLSGKVKLNRADATYSIRAEDGKLYKLLFTQKDTKQIKKYVNRNVIVSGVLAKDEGNKYHGIVTVEAIQQAKISIKSKR